MAKKLIGLKRGTVKLVPYSKQWPAAFAKIEKELRKKIGDHIVAIEHIGSTSIPGMPAKPIIDIAVGVKSIKGYRKYIKLMTSAGLQYVRMFGANKHLFFVKGNDARRTHYVHLVKYKGKIWKNDISFRDYLISHKQAAKQYAKLKHLLAKEFAADRYAYTSAKDAFVKNILKKLH